MKSLILVTKIVGCEIPERFSRNLTMRDFTDEIEAHKWVTESELRWVTITKRWECPDCVAQGILGFCDECFVAYKPYSLAYQSLKKYRDVMKRKNDASIRP